MRDFCKRGFSSVLGVLMVALVVVALGATVYVSQNGTGFSNFASSRRGSQITITGVAGSLAGCSRSWFGGSATATKCIRITDEIDGKTYEVVLTLPIIKDKQIFNKRVKVTGRFDSDSQIASRIIALKIEVLGDADGGGTQNETGLKLKVVPTLATELGKINLAVSWNEALLSNPNLTDFRLNVRPVGGNWMINPDSVGKVSSKDLSGLMTKNGDYQVRLMAFFDNGPMRFEDETVGYFEDQFSGTSLNSVWKREVLKDDRIVRVENGQLKIGDKRSVKKVKLTKIDRLLPANKGFAAQLDFEYVGTGGINNSLSGLFVGSNEGNSAKILGTGYLTYNGGAYTGDADNFNASGTWNFNVFTHKYLPYISTIISKDNKTLDLYESGTYLESKSFGEVKPTAIIGIGVLSGGPDYPTVETFFDNFRLVWVK